MMFRMQALAALLLVGGSAALQDVPSAFAKLSPIESSSGPDHLQRSLAHRKLQNNFRASYLARFQHLADPVCSGPNPTIQVFCLGDIVPVSISHASISCAQVSNEEWSGIQCTNTCSDTTTPCSDVFLEDSNVGEGVFGEIVFQCEGVEVADVDAYMNFVGGEDGTCDGGTLNSRNFHVAQLGVFCEDTGVQCCTAACDGNIFPDDCPELAAPAASQSAYVFNDKDFECGLGADVAKVNGIYTCLEGENCEGSPCTVSFNDLVIDADRQNFHECIESLSGVAVPEEPTREELISPADPGEYSAVFQANWQLSLDPVVCGGDFASKKFTCLNGNIELVEILGNGNVDCTAISDSELECDDQQDAPDNEFVNGFSGLTFRCTSVDAVPEAQADYYSADTICVSEEENAVAHLIQMGVACEDANNGPFTSFADYLFECGENNTYEVIDGRYTCAAANVLKGGETAPLDVASIHTDFRWSRGAYDICYQFTASGTPLPDTTDSSTPEPTTVGTPCEQTDGFLGIGVLGGNDCPEDTTSGPAPAGDCSVYQHTVDAGTTPPLILNYVADVANGVFHGEAVYEGTAWVGFGVSPLGGMVGSRAVIGLADSEANAGVNRYDLGGFAVDLVTLSADNAPPLGGAPESFTQNATHSVLTFSLPLSDLTDSSFSIDTSGGTTNFVIAGGFDDTLAYHGTSRTVLSIAVEACEGGAGATGTPAPGTPAPTMPAMDIPLDETTNPPTATPVATAPTCPQPDAGVACTADFSPVTCGTDACEYNNLCVAQAAGFAELDCSSLATAPPGTVWYVDYRARFKRVVDDGCESPTDETMLIVCEKGSIDIISTSSDAISCTPATDYEDGQGELVICSLACEGTECDTIYIDRESVLIYSFWILQEDLYAEIEYRCSSTDVDGVDSLYLISGSEASGVEGSCTGEGSGSGQNFLFAELNVECPNDTGGMSFVNDDAFSECDIGVISLDVNGNYTCITGNICNDAECLVPYEDMVVQADHHRFQQCIQSDGGYPAPMPAVSEDPPEDGQYTARFQIGSEYNYDEDACEGGKTGLRMTCVDGTIELISSDPDKNCAIVEGSSNEIFCGETQFSVIDEPVDVLEFECTSNNKIPEANAEYVASNITCESTSQESVSRFVNMGVLCGDPGDESYVSLDYFFECAQDNGYDLRTDDSRFSCSTRVQVPENSNVPVDIPAVIAFTDYRFLYFASDRCYSYKAPTTTNFRTASAAKLKELAKTAKEPSSTSSSSSAGAAPEETAFGEGGSSFNTIMSGASSRAVSGLAVALFAVLFAGNV